MTLYAVELLCRIYYYISICIYIYIIHTHIYVHEITRGKMHKREVLHGIAFH